MAILTGTLLYIRKRASGRLGAGVGGGGAFRDLLGLFSKELAVGLIGMMVLWDLVRGPKLFREWVRRRWPYHAAVIASLAIFVAAPIMVFAARRRLHFRWWIIR